ncbi:MAG: D-2-hydroxyacid dehydrogenase [Bacteroidetes bacterium]|nr:D-2-hydroxyacid dehydrogenase [Bacteroidota bacterium]
MKIVATDGYTLNPGDLSWDAIRALGELVVYDRSTVDQLPERCKDAEIVLTNKTPFSKDTLAALPRLRLISVTATGHNIVDSAAAKERKILVSNVPAYGTDSVAQHVWALLLELTNHVGRNARATAAGQWQTAIDWCFTEAPVMELAGKTFGIVGFGHIGQQVARIANAFGMKVLYHTPNKKDTQLAAYASLEELFTNSDVVSLHCPLTATNQEFVNKALLSRMKPTALLINTARGQLINEQELTDALNAGILAGAGLDVLSKEPPVNGNPLLAARNCIITPHNAWISKEARDRIMAVTIANVAAFIKGQPQNVVNA